ncbi:MAG: serine O-acetyltransferase [Alsobacter sp.]
MSVHSYVYSPSRPRLDRCDPVWDRVRAEAEDIARRDMALTSFVISTVLNHDTLESAVVHRIAARLDHGALPSDLVGQSFMEAIDRDPEIGQAMRADIVAVTDRDPACERFIEPILYFKGFHAIQTHRIAHAMWQAGRHDLALYLQSRSSEVFQTDIHPQARLGRGIFLDHATGLVVGSTAVVEDNVSILQDVTLGGTGKEQGDRHPKVRQGVLIGAGAKILGNIEIGQCARVAAGSVVLKPVPRNTTVAGVPARVVGEAGCSDPARTMDQVLKDSMVFDGMGI